MIQRLLESTSERNKPELDKFSPSSFSILTFPVHIRLT
jgi:hypothetical protein